MSTSPFILLARATAANQHVALLESSPAGRFLLPDHDLHALLLLLLPPLLLLHQRLS